MLPPFHGHAPKGEFANSCTPCRELIPALGCRSMCCRAFLVMIAQEDLADGLEVEPPFLDVLKKAPEGHCHYLDLSSGACTAWERRPLICRTYDCREDPRAASRIARGGQLQVRLAPSHCHGCGAPTRLIAGTNSCDGHAICSACGTPFALDYDLDAGSLTIRPVFVAESTRVRYHLNGLMHGQRWAEALDLLEARLSDEEGATPDRLRTRAVLWAELGRFAEAHAALVPLAGSALTGGAPSDFEIDAALDLAWTCTRDARDAEARAIVTPLLPGLTGGRRVRAEVLLGNIARRAQRFDESAAHYLAADREARAGGRPDASIEQRLYELSLADPRGQAAVDRQRLLRFHPGPSP